MKNLTPPKWAPYAIATERGWVHPKTGELLVSLKGLKSRIEKEQPAAVVLEIEPTVECQVENAFIEITTNSGSEDSKTELAPAPEELKEIEPVLEKKGRGRPKNKNNS